VVGEMREIVSKDNHSLSSNSFLLDDDMRKEWEDFKGSETTLPFPSLSSSFYPQSPPSLPLQTQTKPRASLNIPFSAEDIDMAIPAVDADDIELPAFLCEYPCAQFLVSHE
ncbi:myosin-15-like, partial [Trifolium medium]|nr:myosin-15-like [Trifolium medium]